MSRYRLSQAAKEDLLEIALYGDQQFGAHQSDIYKNKLKTHFELLAENPYLFMSVDEIRKGYRRSVCGAHAIYYRVADDGVVEIMRVLKHQNPNLPPPKP